jgi:hypothetical protein
MRSKAKQGVSKLTRAETTRAGSRQSNRCCGAAMPFVDEPAPIYCRLHSLLFELLTNALGTNALNVR